jgi:hypothetical protein
MIIGIKWCIVILLFTLLPFSSHSQTVDNDPIRLELESGKDWYDYSFIPIGNHGILLINRGKLIHQDTALWDFTFYDTNFFKIKTYQIKLLSSLILTSNHFSGSGFYLLFQTSNNKKSFPKTYLLSSSLIDTTLNCLNLKLQEIFPEMNTISQFTADHEHLFLFSSENGNNSFCFYNTNHQAITLKQSIGDNLSESIFLDNTSKKILIAINNYISPTDKNEKGFQLFVSDYSGKDHSYLKFPEYEEYQFRSARIAKTDSNSYLIIGTYNNETDKKPSNLHSGVYTLTYKGGKLGYPNFYNYTSLKTKDTKALIKAQSNNLNLQLVIGNLYTNNEQFGFVTEVYYPEYSTSNYYSPGSYYASTPVSTFDGYRFLNAYVTTFDKDGNLLWDNFIPINDMLTQSLQHKVGLYIDEQNNGYIYYPNNSTITSTLVHNYTVLEPIMNEKLTTLYPKDIIESSAQIRIERWYDNNFLISGYQSIKNPNYGKSGKRFVFFINRLQYR